MRKLGRGRRNTRALDNLSRVLLCELVEAGLQAISGSPSALAWPPTEIIKVSSHRTMAAEDMPDRGLFFSKSYSRHVLASAMKRLAY